MTGASARRRAHAVWVATAALWLGTVVLTANQEPSSVVNAVLMVIPLAIYATLGALIARSHPGNPIGWLLSAVGLALATWIFGLAYAKAGQPIDGTLGTLPGAAAVAWIGVVSGHLTFAALPTFLLLFPDGLLRSGRWRLVIWAIGLGAALFLVGLLGKVDEVGTNLLDPAPWARSIPGTEAMYVAGMVLLAASSFAGFAALILRYRAASAEQRQPLRLLVLMIAAMAVTTVIALVALAATRGEGWIWLVIVLAFMVDTFGVLVGIPLATAAAVLTYGLYDVGVVVKKTVVYVLLVGFFVLLLGLIGLMASPLALLGTGSGSSTEAEVARIVTAAAVFLVVALFLFRPLKRLARRLVYGRRSTPYEAMAEFSERLGDAYSTEDVLPRMAGIIRASTGANVARVWLHVGDEIRPVAVAPGDAPHVGPMGAAGDDLPDMDGLRAFPVRDRGELLGVLTLQMPAAEPLSKDGERLVIDLAGQAGLVLRNVRLIEELQESRRRIVAAQDERARKLERDLHDGAQQQLVALSVKLGLAEQLSARDPERARTVLAELKAEAGEALDTLRDLARGIYPPLLADKGLAAALEAQARKSPVEVRVESDGSGRFPQEVEAAVYFCVLEALQNAAKYSDATSIRVGLRRTDGSLRFEVVDDGRGFDAAATAGGTGLQGMADRLAAVGGRFSVRSSPGEGTAIEGTIPLGGISEAE